MQRNEGLSRIFVSTMHCAVRNLQCWSLDRCRHISPQGTQGLPILQAPTGPETGTDRTPKSLSSMRELKVQGQPTRLRIQISAPSAPSWSRHAPKGRLAPAMAAPNVRSVAALSRTAWDTDKSTARSTAERSPVVCLCREECSTRQSVFTERHSMHQTLVHAQTAPPAPSRRLQQLSAGVDRRLVLLSLCISVQMVGLVVGTKQSAALSTPPNTA
jgi:hypothetical protein